MTVLALSDMFGNQYSLRSGFEKNSAAHTPIHFFSLESAATFLRTLDIPLGFWPYVSAMYFQSKADFDEQSRLNSLARAIYSGELSLCKLKAVDPSRFPPAKRSCEGKGSKIYRIEPRQGLRDIASPNVEQFITVQHVQQFLTGINASDELVDESLAAYTGQRSSGASLEPKQKRIDRLCQLIHQGEIVVLVAPKAQKAYVSEGLELASAIPTVKPVELAPAETSSWVEVVLMGDDDEPIANEEFILVDKEGKEHKGKTDAKGKSKLTGISPGDCKVTFPNLDKSALKAG